MKSIDDNHLPPTRQFGKSVVGLGWKSDGVTCIFNLPCIDRQPDMCDLPSIDRERDNWICFVLDRKNIDEEG